jgi:tetratricopeptide (TPR) repeat protein
MHKPATGKIMSNRSRVVCLVAAIGCLSLFLAEVQAQNTTPTPSPSNAQAGETFALVIGISKYPRLPGGHQLQFADRDARLFADSIKKAGVRPANMRVLIGPEATAAAIKAALGAWLARAPYPADTVYIYFSGHGLVEREFGEAYLLAYDSDPKEPFATAVSVNDISQAVNRRMRARQVLIIADAVRRDLFDPDSNGDAGTKLFTDAFGSLADLRAGISVILASGPNEFSREGQRWGGAGVFTKHAVDALAGAADVNADGAVTGKEFFDFVFNRVAEDTSNKQHAWLAASTLAQMLLSQRPAKPAAAITPPTQPQAVPQQQTAVARAADPESSNRPPLPDSVTRQKHKSAITANEPSPTAAPGTRLDRRNVNPAPSAPGTPSAISTGASSPTTAPGAAKGTVAGRPTGAMPPASKGTTAPPPSRRTSAAVRGKVTAGAATPSAKSKPVESGREAAAAPAGPEATSPSTVITTTAKPAPSPPSVGSVTAGPVSAENHPVASVTPGNSGSVPSPLVLETAAAISAGALIEPRNACAWDYYQKLTQDPASASEASRLKPMLVAALLKDGRFLVTGDVRIDNVAAKVDEFRRAGQMLARLRVLASENEESLILEKLSAAQALIALQFYEEAEKSLTQMQGARLAAVENALGLAYLGNFNEWQAERAFKRAIELDINLAAPHYNLAALYRNQKKDALGEFERAAAIDSSNVAVQVALGDEYFSKEKWGQAADTYRKAIALAPSTENLHTKLAHALYSQGLREEANKEYQKAKELRARQ